MAVVSREVDVAFTKPAEQTTSSPSRFFDFAIVAVTLVTLFSISFGHSLKTGRYLDEWELFGRLHFLPHSIIDYFAAMQSHWCFLIRPGSSALFSTQFFFFGDNPYPYHLSNAAFEICSALFLFMALKTLTKHKLFSFLTAIIFLLYPNHDTTHYSIGCMVHNFALAFFNLSLWLFIVNCEKPSAWLRWGSSAAFLLSITTYEFCMPLFAVHGFAGIYLLHKQGCSVKEALKRTTIWMIPIVLILVAFVIFRTKIVPLMGLSPVYRLGFSVDHAIAVYREALNSSLLPPAFAFFFKTAQQCLREGIGTLGYVSIAIGSAVVLGAAAVLGASRKDSVNAFTMNFDPIMPLFFAALFFVAGYSTFTVAPDYVPTVAGLFDRCNTPATPGVAMVIATLICLLVAPINAKARAVVAAALVVPMCAVFILCNWELGKPWLASTEVQKRIIAVLKERGGELPPNSSVILANTPRWVMWASLFDSTWDFQSALRLILNRQDLKGGVVSERMVISNENVKDISRGYVCGDYTFRDMYMLFPAEGSLQPVGNAQEFIETVERKGMNFGLDRSMPERWRSQLKTF